MGRFGYWSAFNRIAATRCDRRGAVSATTGAAGGFEAGTAAGWRAARFGASSAGRRPLRRPDEPVPAGALGFTALLIGAGGFQHPLAGAQFLGREIQIAAGRGGGRRWRGRARRGRRFPRFQIKGGALFSGRGGAQPAGRRIHPPALGLDDHGLRTPMAEALLHRARTQGPGARLQGQRRAAPGVSTVFAINKLSSLIRSLYSHANPDMDRPPSSCISIGGR